MFLGLEPAGKACERAVGADHPVAGSDDRDRVLAVRRADGARGARLAGRAGFPPIAVKAFGSAAIDAAIAGTDLTRLLSYQVAEAVERTALSVLSV